MFRTFRKDLERYGGRDALFDPGIWALEVYRLGRWAKQKPPGLERRAMLRTYRALAGMIQLGFGVAIPVETEIGEGLHLIHGNSVRIHPDAVIGERCTIMHEVTIGMSGLRGGAPRIGDGVFIGAGAKILGPIQIGNGAMIAACSLVVTDVPANATVMGVPARVIPSRSNGVKPVETPSG